MRTRILSEGSVFQSVPSKEILFVSHREYCFWWWKGSSWPALAFLAESFTVWSEPEPWRKTGNPIILLHRRRLYVQHTVQSTDQSTRTGKKCHADDNPSPLFSPSPLRSHTLWDICGTFQSCCLGDQSLFRGVFKKKKKTKKKKKKKSVLLKFLEYPSAWLELGKSNAGA